MLSPFFLGGTMYEVPTIQRLVKEIDPRFDCHFDHGREAYVITQKSPLGLISVFDLIRYDRLNKGFFDHMRQTIYENRNGNMFQKMMENNAKVEARKAEKAEAHIEDLAKETAPAIHRAFMEM